MGCYQKILEDGSQCGPRYKTQPKPVNIVKNFVLAEEFVGEQSLCLILGDNIFLRPCAISFINSSSVEFTKSIYLPCQRNRLRNPLIAVRNML